MVKGTTSTGFKFSVDPDAIKDMEFIELAAEAEDNGLVLPKMLVKLLELISLLKPIFQLSLLVVPLFTLYLCLNFPAKLIAVG